jgi:hypothetical protein
VADKDQKRKTNKVRNDERKNGKAFKRSGATRNRRTRLSEVQKVLDGGGLLVNTGPDALTRAKTEPWKGMDGVYEPYDRIQAEENRRLYPHLFSGRAS